MKVENVGLLTLSQYNKEDGREFRFLHLEKGCTVREWIKEKKKEKSIL